MKTADWKLPLPVPTGKFSANVKPFKYGDELHHQIYGRLNRAGSSRKARVKTHRDSTGVIWNGLPFYWNQRGNYRGGAVGQRKPLHWHVWEHANGRPVPTQPRHVVVFLDGNKHNFDPANLALRTRGEIAAKNQRHIPAATRASARTRGWTRFARKTVSALLSQNFSMTVNLRRSK